MATPYHLQVKNAWRREHEIVIRAEYGDRGTYGGDMLYRDDEVKHLTAIHSLLVQKRIVHPITIIMHLGVFEIWLDEPYQSTGFARNRI
jgi:hypothetical protein